MVLGKRLELGELLMILGCSGVEEGAGGVERDEVDFH